MELEPVAHGSLVDSVVERLRSGIAENRLAAGDRLPSEFALMDSLRVSRTVLREAVGRLKAVGLIDVRHGSGMYVADQNSLGNTAQLMRSALEISPRELELYVDLRAALECLAARRAAELANDAGLAELEALCEAIDESDLSHQEAFRRDFAFHRKIVELAANPLIANIMEVVRETILEAMARTALHPRSHSVSRKLHRRILQAIKAHDPDEAEKAMRVHMDGILQRLKASNSQQ